MIYLASPYSSPDECVRAQRFCATCRVAGHLMRHGYDIFSPSAHSHPIATLSGGLPKGWAFWGRVDRQFLRMCDELWVLTLPGWRESEGVRAEIEAWNTMDRDPLGPRARGRIRYVDADGVVSDEAPREDR